MSRAWTPSAGIPACLAYASVAAGPAKKESPHPVRYRLVVSDWTSEAASCLVGASVAVSWDATTLGAMRISSSIHLMSKRSSEALGGEQSSLVGACAGVTAARERAPQ